MTRIFLLLSVILFVNLNPLLFGQEKELTRLNRRIIREKDIKTGAERTELYLNKLKNRKVGIVANQTSRIGKTHLVDSLKSLGINIVYIFSPEHGFRGQGEAGENITNASDPVTGIQVVSLYGDKHKPSADEMKNIDIIVFEIQDVGVRFYTYATTMQYLMDACAENKVEMLILDRPNPNGYYVDGPVLQEKNKSFVGLNPIPLVHGLTLGEYASMINGEGWLKNEQKCNLSVIPVFNYNHSYLYQLPVAPSPNLPNMESVYLYPTLGLFEGTSVSIGRGTDKPFQLIGYPGMKDGSITFTPRSRPGFSLNPPYKDKVCSGHDLSEFSENFIRDSGKLYLFWLLEMYKDFPHKKKFFNSYFDKLAGNHEFREQIKNQLPEEEIRKSWAPPLNQYKKLRKKYLLYPDFE